jgi:hypothetical protein
MEQNDHRSETLGQSRQLLVKLRMRLSLVGLAGISSRGRLRRSKLLVATSARGVNSGTDRDPASRAMEPARHRIQSTDRACSSGQSEKCRLKGILGPVVVAENLPAEALYHRAVTLDQRLKRRFGAVARPVPEAIEQRPIRQPGQRAGAE